MAIQDMSAADLAAVMNNDENGFNGSGWWILLLFVLLGGWGWGGNRGAGNGAGSVGGNELYPWMENQGNIFNGFATLTNAVTGGFANAETAATARQMADMEQMFGLSQQFANCCCENRLAVANLQADIARESCATRQTITDGFSQLERTQLAQEIAAERRENDNLRQQINMMNLAASQNAQTAQLLADNFAQTTALEQYLAPTPRPAYMVQNPNCCQQWQGCGCSA